MCYGRIADSVSIVVGCYRESIKIAEGTIECEYFSRHAGQRDLRVTISGRVGQRVGIKAVQPAYSLRSKLCRAVKFIRQLPIQG